jgi:hypothetical protein
MEVERHHGKPSGHGFEDPRAERLTQDREKHDRARVVPVDDSRQRHLTQAVDRTDEAERFDLGRGGCIVETAAEHHELRRRHRPTHPCERMERQGDTLVRSVPPDPEDRRRRATWSFALLVCDGFGRHRGVHAQLDQCGAEGSRPRGCLVVGRQDEVGCPNRPARSRIEPERPPQGPIPLGLETPGFAEPFTQRFGDVWPPPMGPKTKGFPSRERVKPQKRLPQFKWCATSKSCSASSATAALRQPRCHARYSA